ncbi:DUF72 domain-containing protein [Variovorax sp. VNK109]|uniref:DUF72 domain-containing protein n=1 Tax=Variovorax sp. VNK109 TaxID=3400919 RepID=UPI003C0338B2
MARSASVQPASQEESVLELGRRLPPQLRLGTSSWYFPGWKGLVWQGDHSDAVLSKKGLPAYAAHPLMRTVSLDRAFYRPMSASQYASVAAQVPDGFRFVVKAPALVADATVRGEGGRGIQPNPAFLDPLLALNEFVEPALQGLADRTGALVFQLSPLPATVAQRPEQVLEMLDRMLAALPRVAERVEGAVVAVEVRNAGLLTPALVDVLKRHGATYCLGLHAKMPPIEEQLPVLRALWPGPLVCRWNLHRKHGAYGYEEARSLYEPFDRIVDPDPETRDTLARVIAGTVGAGQAAYVTINNKAEGSAPLSVQAVAAAVLAKMKA